MKVGKRASERRLPFLISGKGEKKMKYRPSVLAFFGIVSVSAVLAGNDAGSCIPVEPVEYGEPTFRFECNRDMVPELNWGTYVCEIHVYNNDGLLVQGDAPLLLGQSVFCSEPGDQMDVRVYVFIRSLVNGVVYTYLTWDHLVVYDPDGEILPVIPVRYDDGYEQPAAMLYPGPIQDWCLADE